MYSQFVFVLVVLRTLYLRPFEAQAEENEGIVLLVVVCYYSNIWKPFTSDTLALKKFHFLLPEHKNSFEFRPKFLIRLSKIFCFSFSRVLK